MKLFIRLSTVTVKVNVVPPTVNVSFTLGLLGKLIAIVVYAGLVTYLTMITPLPPACPAWFVESE